MTKRIYQLVSDKSSASLTASTSPIEEPLLSPQRAFVVQFRVEMGTAPERFAGRVEHIVSGRATRFHSPEELLAFFTTLLSTIQDSKEVIP